MKAYLAIPSAVFLNVESDARTGTLLFRWSFLLFNSMYTGSCKCWAATMLMAMATPALHCAATEPTSTPSRDILVGVSNSESGPSRSLGRELTAGSQAYFDVVNARGGIHGRRIRMIIKDDRYEPEPALSNTNDLITREHVLFLFDYVGTPTLTRVLPLLRFYDAEQIVNVAPMTGAEPQRELPYSHYVFNIRASYNEEAEALVEYLYWRGCRRFGFLGQADAYGKSGEVAVGQALSRRGLSIVKSVWYRRGVMFRDSSGMSAQVEDLRASNADAVIVFGVYGPCARFIEEARMAKWSVPIANVSFVDADVLLSKLQEYSKEARMDLTANLVNSEVVPSPYESSSPLVRNFRQHVPSTAHGYMALEGWLNALVASEALERCSGEPSRAVFREALESLRDWDPGLGVKLSFPPETHQALHTVWVTACQQGKWLSVGELVNGRYEEHSR